MRRTRQQKPLKALAGPSGNSDVSNASAGTARAAAPGQSRRACRSVDQWLADLLRAGPVMVYEIEIAAKSFGTSMKSCERAKKRLGVKAVREGRGWAWRLQGGHDVVAQTDQDRHPQPAPTDQDQVTPAAAKVEDSESSRPAFTLGQFMMGQGAAKFSEVAQPRLVPLWSAMGRKRA